MTDFRPDPGEPLMEVGPQKEQTGGKLKIFFGYAAGVGKTYAMLEAAHHAKSMGADVVAGYIEPHTRPETQALLEGLERLPPRRIPYKGIQLQEFDLDGALERRPQLLLVDELAHTNAAGCRHLKRYQDIEELLRAGINVYTTINVQHLESLHDIVAAISGVSIRERVPDKVFDSADQVELVDIEPADLLSGYGRGKSTGRLRPAGPRTTSLPRKTWRPCGRSPCAARPTDWAGPPKQRAVPVWGTSMCLPACRLRPPTPR